MGLQVDIGNLSGPIRALVANSAFRNAYPSRKLWLHELRRRLTSDSRVCLSLTTPAPRNSLTILRSFASLAGKEVDIEAEFSAMPT